MNTNQIVIGITNGDKYILNEFYQNQIKYVKNYVLNNQGNTEDAEDIMQESIMELYKKLRFDNFKIKGSIVSYFFGICKNQWLTKLKNKKRFPTREINETYHEGANDTLRNFLENEEQKYLYKRSFQKLSDENQKILTLYFEGKSMQEIAVTLGFNEVNIRKKKFRAKKKLIEIIQQDPIYQELACF
ncbi:RNA polymerase sigma factor, sigma-70 family [Aquimarina amphilecti]|uniref:RNA polymerase sigma factor, sigma-70 family n=1 Tax=Aquimarina amphilecti TaxID=1038014 RepID=A0A1H7FKK1_AQUAM|nr:sigma-70 family RNA polymerase sigma factor [Aquimarina amphilecti]SEK26633.1 RNA polymerase sigma factor, sigma-70 family [Aquimarina amphilecti]